MIFVFCYVGFLFIVCVTIVSISYFYYPSNYIGDYQAKIDKPIGKVPSCGSAVKKQ